MVMIYLIGVAVMAIAITCFNWDTLKALSKDKNFWLAMLVICLTSWAGVLAAIVIYLTGKYYDHQ